MSPHACLLQLAAGSGSHRARAALSRLPSFNAALRAIALARTPTRASVQRLLPLSMALTELAAASESFRQMDMDPANFKTPQCTCAHVRMSRALCLTLLYQISSSTEYRFDSSISIVETLLEYHGSTRVPG